MNPVQGEVSFETAGKTYTFKLGTYALAVLQRKTGVATMKFFARAQEDWGVADMLAVFHAGLHRQHKMTEEDVADLMDGMGPEEIGRVVREGLALAFKSEAAEGSENPPKAAS